MRLVDEMPKTGSFVAVASYDGFISATEYSYIDGKLNILCYGGDYGDGDVWKEVEFQFEIDEMASDPDVKFVVE